MLLNISQPNFFCMISKRFGSSVPELNLKITLFSKMIVSSIEKGRTFADPFVVSLENFYPRENLDKLCREILIPKFHKVGPSAKKRQITLAGQWSLVKRGTLMCKTQLKQS